MQSSPLLTVSAEGLKKIEFEKVLERISAHAVSIIGKERIAEIVPLRDVNVIDLEHRRVTEAKELLIAEGSIPLDGFKDVRIPLRKTAVENQSLTVQELLDVAFTLQISRLLHAFLIKRKDRCPILASYASQLLVEKVVEYNILETFDAEGSVKDSASRELLHIRRAIAEASETLRRRLMAILRRVSKEELVQDEILTTREGRLVIPVKAEFKNRVSGFVHSTSATGATVYVEPTEVLELNNDLRELHLRLEREISRILLALTRQVGEIREPLAESLESLARIDAIVARAKYSIEILGIAPTTSPSREFILDQARHPILLQRHTREEVVPLSLTLGPDEQTLVITGPNAGGKTVTMKTVGLICACYQAGIHVPAQSETTLHPFDRLFVDIGDDQSIENDLSSFSSHLERLKAILAESDERSLVLIDEIGAGTDPAEGGALAVAFLRELTGRRATTIATTHHGSLKIFAHETSGVVNGSMEFDQGSLRPTYRFRKGIPGGSYAFELAERMGIPGPILSRARSELGMEKTRLEELLLDLEKQMQSSRRIATESSQEQERLQKLTAKYETRLDELNRDAALLRKKAAAEARELVRSARARIEEAVKSIRERGHDSEVVREARNVLRAISQEIREPETAPTPTEGPLVVGDFVRLKEGHQVGEVVAVQGSMVSVSWGNATLRVSRDDLARSTRTTEPIAASTSGYELEGTTELDVRGKLGDEAIADVERFLDNAYSAGLHRVDIIHGKGTGALRKRVTEYLSKYPHVKSHHLGEWNEGGAGVTVVELE